MPAAEFSPEMAVGICERIAGGESLRGILKTEGMPSKALFFQWLQRDEKIRAMYAQAREFQAEGFGDELQEIADNGENDWMEDNRPYCQGWRQNGESVARSRLRFDQRRWWMSHVLPKQYGDKIGVEHSGEVNIGLADRISKARERVK